MHDTTAPPSAQALIRFSVFTNKHGRLNKAFSRNPDGTITKESATQLWDGFVETVSAPNLGAVAQALDALSSDQAIALGVIQGQTPKRVLSEDQANRHQTELQALGQLGLAPTSEFQAEADFVQRNKATFRYPTDSLALYAIDVDDRWDADAPDPSLLNDKYQSLIRATGLARFAHIFRYSNSAGIQGVGHGGNFHLFFAAFPAEIHLIHDLILRLLWSSQLGWISISKAGSLLVRQLIDASVNDPCRLWYEGPPVLTNLVYEPDFTRTRLHAGIPVLTYDALAPSILPPSLPDLTEPAKIAAQPKAEAIRFQAFVERQQADAANLIQLSIKAGRPIDHRALTKALARSYDRITRYLYGQLPLYFSDSTIATVDQILLDEALARVRASQSTYHDRTLRDPLEPDYQNFKVTAKLWTDGAPQIHSQAHGGRTFRLLLSADTFLQHYLPLATRDERHAFIGMAAEFVAPDDEPHVLARLKSGDKTCWKNARATFIDLRSPEATEEDIERFSNVKPIPKSIADVYAEEFPDTVYLGSQRYAQFPHDTRRWVFGNQRRPVINQVFAIFNRISGIQPKLETWLGNSRNADLVEKSICYGARQVEPELFDANSSILGLPGGYVLDFTDTAIIRETTPGDYVSKYLPFFPTPGPTPDWDNTLVQICGFDTDQAEAIIDMLAQALANVPQKRVLIIHGPSNTGKSVLVESIAELFGPYAGPIMREAVVSEKYRDEDKMRQALHGAIGRRFVYISELMVGNVFNTIALKNLTGGDTLLTRALYQNPVQGTFSGLPVITTNFLPSLATLDQSFQDRIYMIQPQIPYMLPNGQDFSGSQYARGLSDIRQRLRAQGGAFLHKLIERIHYYHRLGGWNHLHIPESMKCQAGTFTYNDHVLNFFMDNYTESDGKSGIPFSEMYALYEVSTRSQNMRPLSRSEFGRRVSRDTKFRIAKEGSSVQVGDEMVLIGAQDKAHAGSYRGETIRLCVLKGER